MLVEHMLATAGKRLVVIGSDAPGRQAAAMMGEPHADMIAACTADGRMAGVLTKTGLLARSAAAQATAACRRSAAS